MSIDIAHAVAEKIKELYTIAGELEQIYPGRHYTPDGHMVGSIGEALAASYYDLTLFEASTEKHDAKTADGRFVQIKTTQVGRIALSSQPDWLLVLLLHKDGSFSEVYNGPGDIVWNACGTMQKNGQRPITVTKLSELQKIVPKEKRIVRYTISDSDLLPQKSEG